MRRGTAVRSALVAVALTAALGALAGCSRSGGTLGETDDGRTVTIAEGEQLVVRLPSNQTTGFSWVVTDNARLEQVGDAAYDAPQQSGLAGAGGTETFTFVGSGRGEGRLELEYRRPWESGIPAQKTWGVTVEIE